MPRVEIPICTAPKMIDKKDRHRIQIHVAAIGCLKWFSDFFLKKILGFALRGTHLFTRQTAMTATIPVRRKIRPHQIPAPIFS